MTSIKKKFVSVKMRMIMMALLVVMISAFSFGCSKSTSSDNNDGPNGINPAEYSYYMGVIKNTEYKSSYSIMFYSEKVIINTVELKINNEEVPLESMFGIWGNLNYDFTEGETYSFEVTINGDKDVESLEMAIPSEINVNWPENIDFSVENTISWTLENNPMMQIFSGESYNYISGEEVSKEADLAVGDRSYVIPVNWLPNETVDNTLTVEADNYHSGSKLFAMAISSNSISYRGNKDFKEFINDMKRHIVEVSKKIK